MSGQMAVFRKMCFCNIEKGLVVCLTLILKSRIANVNESDRRLFFIASGGDAALADLDRHN